MKEYLHSLLINGSVRSHLGKSLKGTNPICSTLADEPINKQTAIGILKSLMEENEATTQSGHNLIYITVVIFDNPAPF